MLKQLNETLSSNLLKLISIICFILLIIAMLSAWSKPAVNFEYSIYSSTPVIVWVSLATCILCGIFFILLDVYHKKTSIRAYNIGFIGVLLLVFCYVITLSLGIVRGYYVQGMDFDPGTHLGLINQILYTGTFEPDNIYPVLHVYVAELITLSNVSLIFLHKFVPLFFSVLFILFMYLLLKRLLPNRNLIILSLIPVCATISGWYINLSPNHLANMLFPMALLIIFNFYFTSRLSWAFLSGLVVIMYPLFHPLPALVLIFITISLSLASLVYPLLFKKEKAPGLSLLLPLAFIVWWYQWVQSHFIFNTGILGMSRSLFDMSSNEFNKLSSQIDYAQSFGYNVYLEALKLEAGFVFCLLIAILAIPYALKVYSQHKNKLFPVYLSIISICAIMAFLFLSKTLFGPTRVLYYVIILCMLLGGLFFEMVIDLLTKVRHNAIKIASILAISLLVTIVYVNGMFIVYPSPYTVSQGVSLHTTNMGMSGLSWIYQTRDSQSYITGIGTPIYKYAGYFLNINEGVDPIAQKKYIPKNLVVRYHFDYNDTSIDPLNNVFLVITEKDQSYYRDIYPAVAADRFTTGDFTAINGNVYFQKILSNGGIDVYYR